MSQDQKFRIWKLEFGFYLEFGYWDLRFKTVQTKVCGVWNDGNPNARQSC
jgi:hypothetical protein